eukprot:scaffold29266_cov18-Tisochrysis_lutea.AAC.1
MDPVLHASTRRPAAGLGGGEGTMLNSRAPPAQLPTLPSARTTAAKAWGGRLSDACGCVPAAAAAGAAAAWSRPKGCSAWRLCAEAVLGRGIRWVMSARVRGGGAAGCFFRDHDDDDGQHT